MRAEHVVISVRIKTVTAHVSLVAFMGQERMTKRKRDEQEKKEARQRSQRKYSEMESEKEKERVLREEKEEERECSNTNRKLILISDQTNNNQQTSKPANSVAATHCNVRETHLTISPAGTGPVHSKWHEACKGTPGQNSFCVMRRFRQTGNGPRPMHSGPQGKSELCVQS